MYIHNGETCSRKDAVKEACDAILQVLLNWTDYRIYYLKLTENKGAVLSTQVPKQEVVRE